MSAMKVLWITSSNFMPEIAQALGLSCYGTGGWMWAMLQQLRNYSENEIVVAYVSKKVKEPICRNINGIEYWLYPTMKQSWEYDESLEDYWRQLNKHLRPDIVHIHGTEYSYGLAYIRACGAQKVVVSIQGLVSEIGKVYYAGISESEIKRTETLSDIFFSKGLKHSRKHIYIRGEYEKEYFRLVKYVIGRTDWDKSVVLNINPQLKYYTNNESLNDVFYNHIWQYEKCEPHTILVAQCASPIKGFHILLKAMPIVLKRYPDTQIFVAGSQKVYPNTIKQWLSDNGYYAYLRQQIKKYELKDKITFLGVLSPEEMCTKYLNSNLYLMCSAIDNSSNAFGEAQLLGMPTIATSAAGNPSMTQHGELSLQYDYEDYEQLAKNIIKIFSGEYDKRMFKKAQEVAHMRHSKNNNADVLMHIYKDIISNGDKY